MNSIKLTNLFERQYVAKCPICWCRMSSIKVHCFSFSTQLFLDRYWLAFTEGLWSFHQQLDRLNISGDFYPVPFILMLYTFVEIVFSWSWSWNINFHDMGICLCWWAFVNIFFWFIFAFILHSTVVSPDFFILHHFPFADFVPLVIYSYFLKVI